MLLDSSTDFVRLLHPASEVDLTELSPLELGVVEWLAAFDEPQSVARLRRERGSRSQWLPVIRRLEERGLVELSIEGPRVKPPVQTRRIATICAELATLRRRDEMFGRAYRQREAYETLENLGGNAEVTHLTEQLGFSRSVLNGLQRKGLIAFEHEEVSRDPYAGVDAGTAPDLRPSADQAVAIRRLIQASRSAEPGTFLLRGVTGSGKTLVYIELLRDVVQRQGKTAIVLVPEIALTPQTVGRFRAAFGDRVAVLHSALSEGERYDEWRALKSGEKQIVVGARSAIFAPVEKLGAVVVDEEHETTYKQADSPRYHAREVAVMRAELAGAVCVLGSATPSLESWTNAQAGKFELLELPERIAARPLPPIQVVDLRSERKKQRSEGFDGDGAGILSPPLRAAIEQRLACGEQIILLLNRRGYATFVQCRECGHVWHCPHCNVSLTFHRRRNRLTCHYCLHEEAQPKSCTACGSADLSFRGIGTEQGGTQCR